MLIAEWNGPATLLVETVEGVDQVPEEGVTSLLSISDDVDAGVLLEANGGDDPAVLLALEISGA